MFGDWMNVVVVECFFFGYFIFRKIFVVSSNLCVYNVGTCKVIKENVVCLYIEKLFSICFYSLSIYFVHDP
jgi:hypothetical protein